MPETKPLWLVRPRLSASQYRDKLIGSVVKYPDLPTERFIPSPSPNHHHHHQRTLLPKEIVPSLDPQPVTVHNVRFWTRRIKDEGVHASVGEILEGFARRGEEIADESVATVARVWHMDRPGEKFGALIRDDGYFGELMALLGGCARGEGFFVTDVVSLACVRVSALEDSSAGFGSSMGLPVLEMSTGMPTGLRPPSAGARSLSQTSRGFTASCEEETIVFLGYRLIRLEKVRGLRAKLKRMMSPFCRRGGAMGGYTVRDGFDYWPEMVERAVEGNAEAFLAAETPRIARLCGVVEEREWEWEEIVGELGFDVEVVG